MHRFLTENPFISGNSCTRSEDKQSMTLEPQPSRSCRVRMSLPICQPKGNNKAGFPPRNIGDFGFHAHIREK